MGASLRAAPRHESVPDDPILPLELAESLHATMAEAGWDAEFVRFSGGHTIGAEALVGLRSFLRRVLLT